MIKILQIGNYPPPLCGWAVQTKLVTDAIRRRGHVCDVLNINENRKVKSREYIDVQNGFDYLFKLFLFALKGYRFHVNVNGQSKPGYLLAISALIVGRLFRCPPALSWRGGLQQKYFPCKRGFTRWAYRQLFRLAGAISCDSVPVKRAIEDYGIAAERIVATPPFSKQNLVFTPVSLPETVNQFLNQHEHVFFCYVSFRPEYELDLLRDAMRNFRTIHRDAGFVWLGFPSKELPLAETYVSEWDENERQGLLLLGNLPHDEFLTLLTRTTAYLRTPMCDGVAASILEALALGVPVVASDNGTRPDGVVTYRHGDEEDMRAKLALVLERHPQIEGRTRLSQLDDNIERAADWLLGNGPVAAAQRDAELVDAY